jgi:hypothetical protein
MTSGGTGSYVFKVTYRDDTAVRVSSLDNYDIYVFGPNGYVRRAAFVSVNATSDGMVRTATYKVAPFGTWDATDNGRYRVVLQPNQVFDVFDTPANDGIIDEFLVNVGGVANPTPPAPPTGTDVRDFGAFPNDGIDDTAAIQAAIDWLPSSSGVPNGQRPAGGIILFPAGVFDISSSLMVHSGVTLRGAGSATVLHDVGTNRNHAAILLYSPFSHHFNIAVTIENMTIYTRWGGGIWVDPNMGGDVTDLRLADLRISAKGTAIDLRNQSLYHSDLEDVEVYNPGSTALRLGRYDGFGGADVRVRDFRVTGVARSGFAAEAGMVQLVGHNTVWGMTLNYTGANVVPLYASDLLYNSSGLGSTMFDVAISVPAANCPGGVAALFENVARMDIDYLNGIGRDRKLKLVNAHDVQINYLQGDGSSNVVSQITAKDSRSWLRIGNASGGKLLYPPRQTINNPHVRSPAPTNVIDARDFGVIPDDLQDDTIALQRAIDSLPRGNGVPGTGGAVGGIVQLPLGELNTSAPIKLPSGVWLRGHNNGTVIRNESPLLAGRGVIELTSPYTHRRNVGAGIDSLGLWSAAASAITADSTLVSGELRDLRIVAVHINVAGAGIDLSNVQLNYAHIERIVITNTGTKAAIWLGREDNSSVGNLARGVRVTGAIRNTFVPTDKGLFTYMGDTTIEGGTIGDPAQVAPILPFYGSGKVNITGLWLEYPQHPTNIGFLLDNATGTIDWLAHIDMWHRLHLINGSDMTIRCLNIDGFYEFLRDTISVDGTSKLTLNTVYALYDSGMLDHPRVFVKGFYNSATDCFFETALSTGGTNLLADPNMTNVGDVIDGGTPWEIIWNDGYQGRMGNYTVETLAGGVKRLRIDLTQSTRFSIRIKMNVPSSALGRLGLARWRADGPMQAFVWNYATTHEYRARSMGSMTGARTSIPIASNEQMWILVGSPSQPAPVGTYYFWKIGLTAL